MRDRAKHINTQTAKKEVEQNLKKALSIANRGYILNRGEIVLQDSAENLLQNENVIKAYLGEG